MRIDVRALKRMCRQRGTTLAELLRDAGVSRNAFYTLARKPTVLAQSIIAVADQLQVSPSRFLRDDGTVRQRTLRLLDEVERISDQHPIAERDNVRHTLLLLEERPVDRLRRALRRGRSIDSHH